MSRTSEVPEADASSSEVLVDGSPPAARPPTLFGSERGRDGGSVTDNVRMPKIKLTTFKGDVNMYKEWKREVMATAALYNVGDAQLSGLIYLALESGPGKPRDLLSHLEVPGDICSTEGLKTIWKILDDEYVREAYVRSDEAQGRYERTRRLPGQKMDAYIRELKPSKRLLEKEAPARPSAMCRLPGSCCATAVLIA